MYIHVCAYILGLLYSCLNETKKEARQINQHQRVNVEITNMHRRYRRQDRYSGWLDHIHVAAR